MPKYVIASTYGNYFLKALIFDYFTAYSAGPIGLSFFIVLFRTQTFVIRSRSSVMIFFSSLEMYDCEIPR